MNNKNNRRITRLRFLTVVFGIGAVLVLTGFASALAASKPVVWKLQSCWTAGDFTQNNPKDFAKKVKEMSGGRFRIDVMAAGSIVPAFEVLDAVHKGILDAGNSWAGYWMGKHPAATLFSSVPGGPFGMNSEDFLGWIYLGGGLELYNEMLQKELKMDVVSLPTFGETPEPLGWFPRPIKSVADFKGLKFRASGMSAEVFKEMGMSVVTVSGGEIVPALERGVIDAGEWSDPSADMSLGFQDVRKFYHMPGIHQPTGMMEVLINKKKWDKLPDDLKAIVKYAAMSEALEFSLLMLHRNSLDLMTLINKHGVTVVQTPREILLEVLKAWDRVAEKEAKKNPFFAKVLASQKKWAERVVAYRRVGHPPYDLAAEYYWGNINPYRVVKP